MGMGLPKKLLLLVITTWPLIGLFFFMDYLFWGGLIGMNDGNPNIFSLILILTIFIAVLMPALYARALFDTNKEIDISNKFLARTILIGNYAIVPLCAFFFSVLLAPAVLLNQLVLIIAWFHVYWKDEPAPSAPESTGG